MIDGHETHYIPQMGKDRWWYDQYKQGKITKEEWIDAFLNNSPTIGDDEIMVLALEQGKVTMSEVVTYRETGIIPPFLLP